MRAFINPAVQRIGVSSANGDGWIIEIGSGIRPSKEEMDVVLNSCYHQAIQNMQDDPYFYGWSFEERSYMLAREQMRLVTNYFEWDVMGGEMA